MNDDISNWWHLCDELTIDQAAFLIVGTDPDSEIGVKSRDWRVEERPAGYGAARQGLTKNLSNGIIQGSHFEEIDYDQNGNPMGNIPGTTDIYRSTVMADSVVKWLHSRGVRTGFFFPDTPTTDTPGYLDPNNPRYAPKLAAAVKAWEAMSDPELIGKLKPKDALNRWLEVNYKALGLVHNKSSSKDGYEIGGMSRSAVTAVAEFANWETAGTPPKPPSTEPTPQPG